MLCILFLYHIWHVPRHFIFLLLFSLYLLFWCSKEQQRGRSYMGLLAFVHYPELGEKKSMEPLFRPINLNFYVIFPESFILDLFFCLRQSLMMTWEILNWSFTWSQRRLSLLYLFAGKCFWMQNRCTHQLVNSFIILVLFWEYFF